jgi:hypothetical protein
VSDVSEVFMEQTRETSPDVQRFVEYLDVVLPVVGVLVVLAGVVFVPTRWEQVWVAVAGLIILEAGVWKLANRIVHERRYIALREEVQGFVELVRALNHSAVVLKEGGDGAHRQAIEETSAAMRASVERMIQAAGKAKDDPDG